MRNAYTLLVSIIVLSRICLATYTPQYETYTTYSVDDTYIYQTVVVDGTTTGDCYYQCQYGQCQIPGCSGAVHTPSINNVLGDVGGLTTGQANSMFVYTSYQTTSQLQYVLGQDYVTSTEGRVLCSAVSAFLIDSAIDALLQVVQSPACGHVTVSATSKKVACNGTTTYHGNLSIGGQHPENVRSFNVATSTDNVPLIELLGAPYNPPSGCNLCRQVDFKAHAFPQNPKGNIIWATDIFCGGGNPDIHVDKKESVECQ